MIKIGIVDDHAIVRAGLKQFLSEQVDLRVEGEAGNGREAIDLVRTTELDVLIMDLAMPGQSGLDALAMIRAKAPDLGILILSGYPEEQYAINLIRQGASGYLNKECDPAEIVDAVRTIALGRRHITPAVAELLAQQLGRKAEAPLHEQLSEREFQVFLKLAKGESAGDVAESLSLSVKTVSTYRTRLMEKMGLATNSDLTYYALKNQLIDRTSRQRLSPSGPGLLWCPSRRLLDAVVHQRVDLVGFVEHRIGPQRSTAGTDVGRGVVAQHHQLLAGRPLAAGGQHTQPAALLEEEVDDGQVPALGVAGQPLFAIVFGFGAAGSLDAGQFFQRADQVLADGRVVFDDVGSQSHGAFHPVQWRLQWRPTARVWAYGSTVCGPAVEFCQRAERAVVS